MTLPANVDEPLPPDVAGAPATTAVAIDPLAGGGTVVTSTPTVPAFPGAPSWLTGEFYAAIAPLAAGLITVATGKHLVAAQVQDWLVGAGVIVLGAWALARTLLKAVHVHAAASVARSQAIAAAQAMARTPPASAGLTHGDAQLLAAAVVDAMAVRFTLPARRAPRKAAAR